MGPRRGCRRLWLATAALGAALLIPAGTALAQAAAGAAVGSTSLPVPGLAAPLWSYADPVLERELARSMRRLGLGGALDYGRLGVALVDVSDLRQPRVAALNGDRMFYAASLPKIAVMLAVFEKAWTGQMDIDPETWEQLVRMIRVSSNRDSTALMHKVGKPYIAAVLLDPRYRLYDPLLGGGLWVGKDYAKQGVWRRDPVHHLSHAATPMQVARFLYMLQSGELVSRQASAEMKRLMAETAIDHKFVKGLRTKRPGVRIYRKSGTWKQWHADAALIERPDGTNYIAVGLAESQWGGEWLQNIIVAMDGILDAWPRTPSVLAAGG